MTIQGLNFNTSVNGTTNYLGGGLNTSFRGQSKENPTQSTSPSNGTTVGVNMATFGTPVYGAAQAGKPEAKLGANLQLLG